MPELKLYNSLTRQKELFKPIDANHVRLYVCGMTVYDYCHIGHARVMVVFDVLSRYLRQYYPLTFVRNITDIDDKIIVRAQQNNKNVAQLTQRFIQAMHEDEAALGCLLPDIEPKATENINGMIEMIGRLIKKGFAYAADNGDVYYSVRQFPTYGKLSNRKLEDLRAGERIAINEAKRDPLDFVLWKAAKVDEPSWPSPWGEGRPGWHIECSEMSQKFLGDYFDIHGGGMDLKFPHHECEIAQSEADTGHKNVNYWVHNGFVQINDEKMSKSLGNFFTVREVLKNYEGEVIRFFMLQTHYRAPLNFSDGGLDESRKGLLRLYNAVGDEDNLTAYFDETHPSIGLFYTAMNDDLNTVKAIAILFDLAKLINKTAGAEKLKHQSILKTLAAQLGLLSQSMQVFSAAKSDQSTLNTNEIEDRLAQRQQAKAAKDFKTADRIRDELLAQGIVIKDTVNGSEWHYQ